MKSLEIMFILTLGVAFGCIISLFGMAFFPASASTLIFMVFTSTTMLRFREYIPIPITT